MIDRVYTIEHKKWDKKFSLTLEPISPKNDNSYTHWKTILIMTKKMWL